MKMDLLSFANGRVFVQCSQWFFTTAVELVEEGRGVFWTQLEHFCIPLDKLSMSGDAGATLAAEFKQLSLRLYNTFYGSTEDQSQHIRQMTVQ